MNKQHFNFGSNWKDFSRTIDQTAIDAAVESLRSCLDVNSLEEKTFLDAGCGSGLFSLAAVDMGAKNVRSFDYSRDSVETTIKIKQKFAPDSKNWEIGLGDILDREYMGRLGCFDIVYSWGVLHHTGDMFASFDNISDSVKEGGLLYISIYNDQGYKSHIWRFVKKIYNLLWRPFRPIYVLLFALPFEIKHFIANIILRRRPENKERGMKKYYDWVDWIGGFPFEVAKPDQVFNFYKNKGYDLFFLNTENCGHGCNEYVFKKKGGRI